MNSKRIGLILAAVFVIGLSFATIYSRSYAQRHKPFVQLVLPESGTFFWEYDTHSTIQPANEVFAALGVEWTIEIILPLHAWDDYMNEPPPLVTYVVSENVNAPERVEIIRTQHLDNGDILIIYQYIPLLNQWRGDGARHQTLPGERVTVNIAANHPLAISDTLVPFSAIHRDIATGEYYMFSVSRRNGVWGREYIAHRHTVRLGRPYRLGHMANLGFVPAVPIVVYSDRPLYDGANIRLFD